MPKQLAWLGRTALVNGFFFTLLMGDTFGSHAAERVTGFNRDFLTVVTEPGRIG
jgi:hypothetical protein